MISRREKVRFLILHTFGNFFILLSLYGMVSTFGPIVWQEAAYHYRQVRGIRYVVDQGYSLPPSPARPGGGLARALEKAPEVRILKPASVDFSILIPKIGASAKVIPDVNPAEPKDYLAALQEGVAHAKGTGFPGVESWNRNIYLFAHSTDFSWNIARYNAIFYLIKELEKGDEVDLFFEGKRYLYQVIDKKIVNPSEIDYLTTPSAREQLILQTCWPPGTNLNRLLIFAEPKAELSVAVNAR